MPLDLFLLISGLELLVMITILAPTVLPGRFNRNPSFGILLWLTGFAGGLASLGLVVVSLLSLVVGSYARLSEVPLQTTDWVGVLLISFAPWLLMAGAGASLVIANQRLFGARVTQQQLKRQIDLLGPATFRFRGVEVFVLPVNAPIAAAYSGRILISRSLDALPQDLREAVLLHERAHLRLGHNTLRGLANLVARLLPGLAAAESMRAELQRLSELAADAWATRYCAAETLAQAKAQYQEFLPTSVR
jgi:Zn-dependent protease with chaperone function